MTVLTLISAPKPLADERIGVIQENALASWSRLADVEVFVMGDGAGLRDIARTYAAAHFREVRTNAKGTPLISSMLEIGREHAHGELLGLVNADMILMSDLVDAIRAIGSAVKNYVALGRRWDLDVAGPLDFGGDWETRLRQRVVTAGQLHPPSGSDIFVFPNALFAEVPDFAVGRAGWDNWMIFSARQRGIAVVDCTASVMMVHQNHDYSHLPGGMPHYALPETDENIRLAGGTAAIRYTLLDTTHELRAGKLLRPRPSWERMLRAFELQLRRLLFFVPSSRVEAWARPKRWRKRWQRLLGAAKADPQKPTDSAGTGTGRKGA